MGRHSSQEKAELRKKLDLENSKKNWSLKELRELDKKRQEKQKEEDEKAKLVNLIAGPPPTGKAADLAIPYDMGSTEDPFEGLTERQKMIVQLRLRGMTQAAIAHVLNTTQSRISLEQTAIKEWQAKRGKDVDQPVIVGETKSVYEEVESQAWGLFYSAAEPADKAKMLTVVMQAREKQTKLLMDLGLLKKASHEVKHTVEVSPWVKDWKDDKEKKEFANSIIVEKLPPLEEPCLDESVDEGEIVEDDFD